MAPHPDWHHDLTGPPWARRIWASRGGRISASLFLLTVMVWVLASGFSDPNGFFDGPRSILAFILAPPLIAMFGWTLAEAVRDLARGENRRPFMTRPQASPLITILFAIYVIVAIVAYLLWH